MPKSRCYQLIWHYQPDQNPAYNLIMFGLWLLPWLLPCLLYSATTAKKQARGANTAPSCMARTGRGTQKPLKAKAHEKELKLARELQTERNKLDELLGREVSPQVGKLSSIFI